MISQDQLQGLIGATAYDPSGDKIGKVGAVYYDDRTDQPTWVTVHTGLFGTNESFVPVQGADFGGSDRVTLGYDKAVIKDAPNVSEDGHLSPQDEERLYRHYSVDYGSGYDTDRTTGVGTADTGRHGLTGTDRDRDRDGVYDDVEGRTVGHDTSGPTTDQAMTRSEEQLRVGTERAEVGRARLRKYVVTEQQSVTVPVTREEVTVEREPITDANRGNAYDGPAISEEEHEVVLHAERPVVDTEAVAVERVRLGKETVTENQVVRGEVRKEEVELDRGDRGVADRGVTDRDVTDRDVTDRDVTDRDVTDRDVTDRDVVGGRGRDRDRDGVPDSVDRHDDRSVGEKVKDAVTPDRKDRR